MKPDPFESRWPVTEESAGAVLAALRKLQPGLSWSAARQLMSVRRIAINGTLCLDEGRRVVSGEVIGVTRQPMPAAPFDKDVTLLHLDRQVVVAEKPAGMVSLRHPAEYEWSGERRALHPTLDECLARLIRRKVGPNEAWTAKDGEDGRPGGLYSVHRIDRDTSGLLVFARTEQSQEKLIAQFAAHAAVRRYLCLIDGVIPDQTIRSTIVRDRGDGLRGSLEKGVGLDPASGLPRKQDGQHAVTHIQTLRRLENYSELECRLETGRTNQIRIHLAEAGFPVCGDIKYRGPYNTPAIPERSHVPRLALHAAALGFQHPKTGEELHFTTPWPADIQRFLNKLTATPSPQPQRQEET